MFNDQCELDRVREGIDAVAFVQNYMHLKRSGAEYSGRCPFHKDRTPSFFLHPAKKLWKCYGCKLVGDLFSFVMRIEHVSFLRAKEILASAAGVPLSNWTRDQRIEFARRMQAVEPEAKRLVEWKFETLEALRYQRNILLRTYHNAIQFILSHSHEHCECRGDLRFELALAIGDTYWERVEEWDDAIDRLQKTTYEDLLLRFRGVA